MNKMKNIAKKILTGVMIVAVAAAIVVRPHYNRPKGEDKIGYSIMIKDPIKNASH